MPGPASSHPSSAAPASIARMIAVRGSKSLERTKGVSARPRDGLSRPSRPPADVSPPLGDGVLVHGTRCADRVGVVVVFLLFLFGPWIAMLVVPAMTYRAMRRRPEAARAAVAAVAGSVAFATAAVAWAAYVQPGIDSLNHYCSGNASGLAVVGYAAVLVPPFLLAASAGLAPAPRARSLFGWLATGAAFIALFALGELQGALLCGLGG